MFRIESPGGGKVIDPPSGKVMVFTSRKGAENYRARILFEMPSKDLPLSIIDDGEAPYPGMMTGAPRGTLIR